MNARFKSPRWGGRLFAGVWVDADCPRARGIRTRWTPARAVHGHRWKRRYPHAEADRPVVLGRPCRVTWVPDSSLFPLVLWSSGPQVLQDKNPREPKRFARPGSHVGTARIARKRDQELTLEDQRTRGSALFRHRWLASPERPRWADVALGQDGPGIRLPCVWPGCLGRRDMFGVPDLGYS
jgi:hypothetical protein